MILDKLMQQLAEIKRKNPEAGYAEVKMTQYESGWSDEDITSIETKGEKVTEILLC
jgi:hypothetical protein